MILSRMTWCEVEDLDRACVVLIPTGALEQHGPHLPLFTDSLIAGAVAEAVERNLPGEVLLTPTVWLGASAHHLAFAGTLSASFEAYMRSLQSVIESLEPHGFEKFFIVNGHGGNTEPNGLALREIKRRFPNLTVGHVGYFDYSQEVAAKVMEGPIREIRHACEAETSLALHLFPDLVRRDLLRDDGLTPNPPFAGIVATFDEVTEEGSFGYATLASAEKGKAIFDAAVDGLTRDVAALARGFRFEGLPPRD